MKKLKIEMILDLNCSWCPIAYKYISNALDNLNISDTLVDFQFLPFQINPGLADEGELINDNLKRKTGQNDNELIMYRKELTDICKKAGVELNFEKRTHYYNTLIGHQILQIAQKYKQQRDVYEILCEVYYKNGHKFSDENVIEKVAGALVLSKQDLLSLLEERSVNEELVNKEHYVKSLNVHSVPTFVMNNTEIIQGSNSVTFFENILRKYYSEYSSPTLLDVGSIQEM